MSALSAAAVSLLYGGAIGAGLLCMLAAVPRWGAIPLMARIAPYVRDVVADADLPAEALPRFARLPADRSSPAARARAIFENLAGRSESLRRRLARAGLASSPARFRGRQLVWAVAGTATGAVASIAIALAGGMSPLVALLPLLAAAGAVLMYDMQLTARITARRARLTDELPTTLEFLALCLSAGEGFLDAVKRVSTAGSGELAREFRNVVLATGTGSPLAEALTEAAIRVDLPGLTRAIDQVVAALQHGAPLATVLHAQAQDAREEAKRVLIEQAGRKEILMLRPLVFLILPLSVLFAIYPGLFILRLGIG